MNIHISTFGHVEPANLDSALPSPHKDDDASLNLRNVLVERRLYGIPEVSSASADRIREQGYDAYFLGCVCGRGKIGGKVFQKLRDAGRLDLTTEYIVFHHFREKLDRDMRRGIAALLARCVSHPHARWEENSRR